MTNREHHTENTFDDAVAGVNRALATTPGEVEALAEPLYRLPHEYMRLGLTPWTKEEFDYLTEQEARASR